MSRLQIFKTGRHIASNGKVVDFTQADLEATVAAYDPKLSQAPFVIGHPKDADPAYGWAGALAAGEGGIMEADPEKVDPAFAEMVNSGKFNRVSSSFYEPDSPSNPKPGVYYLRHVGFLGAQPPSVKGLKTASFADGEEGVIEFADWSDVNVANLLRSVRDWIIGKFGLDEANKAMPDWQVNSAQSDAARDTGNGINYSERNTHVMTPAQIAAKEQELKDREKAVTDGETALTTRTTEFSERETGLTARERQAQQAETVSFADGLITAGKLLPAHKDDLVAFMCGLKSGDTVEFGEGTGKKKEPASAWLRGFLTSLPKIVEFKEVGAGDGSAEAGDLSAEQLAAKVLEFQESEKKAGRTVSVTLAMKHVKSQLVKK